MMSSQQYSSRLLENAVNEFAKLPGIGRKTALRLVLYLLKQDSGAVNVFAETVRQMRSDIRYCKSCNNISDTDICHICADNKRDGSVICVVESVRDVMAVENTRQFNGLYHVLGGVISPMDGVGPDDINISSLEEKARSGSVKEVILALSTTMEGDTTNFYIFKRLNGAPVVITTIARGVSVGDELEYADEVTLGRSLVNRLPFDKTI